MFNFIFGTGYPKNKFMKLKYAINLHKGATAFLVLSLMFIYNNFSYGAWAYLALHGSYGFLWLFKDRTYPDKQWEEVVPLWYAVVGFLALCLYWVPAWILINYRMEPPAYIICVATVLNLVGGVLHFGSDAQKHYTLQYKKGLITDGFFARCRNTNYLGEFMIYVGFATLSMHWAGYVPILLFFAFVFIPNMLKKDKSISRYPEFAEYKKRSGLFLPRLF